VAPGNLIVVLIKSFVLRMPSLESIGNTFGASLGTANKSTLSYAMDRLMSVKVARAMSAKLGDHCRPGRGDIVVIDSMAVTLPMTQRGNAAKFNNQTAGMGVVWQFCLDAPKGTCPVRILKTMRGAWNDSYQIRSCALEPSGPIYVMDQGFWSLVSARQWLQCKVRFVVRAKAHQCHYQILQTKGPARQVGKVRIVLDSVALVGKDPRTQIIVRLVWCEIGGKSLILASSQMDASAKQLLQIYKNRWAIERFHKVIKHVLGLAHLYSFQANGLELLVHVAFLLAALVYLISSDPHLPDDRVKLLRVVLQQIRNQLGISHWKPNICTHKWRKKQGTNH
jgi:hypothetical protein